jgi:pentatricopeptide repeat protein
MEGSFSVLMVDDQVHMRILLRKMLQQMGGFDEIDEAESVMAAWDMMKKKKGSPYDLVICDIEMPDLDGYVLAERCRDENDYHEVPFIMLSEEPQVVTLVNILDCGAFDCLVKPFALTTLKKHVEAVISIAKSQEIGIYRRAEKEKNDGKLQEAIRQVDVILEACHAFLKPRVYNLKGECLMGTGDMDPAIECFEKAIESCQIWLPAYDNYASLMEKMGNYPKAAELIQKAFEMSQDVKREFVLRRLQSCWDKQVDEEEQAAEAREAEPVESEPEEEQGEGIPVTRNYEYSLKIGHVFLKNGRYEKAEQVFMKMLESKPVPASAYKNLSVALRKQGKFDKAEHFCDVGLKDHPNEPSLLLSLGLLQLDRGRKPEAAKSLRRALLFDPGLEEAKEALQGIGG